MEWAIYNVVTITLNSEIFARVYIRETSHMQSFVKIVEMAKLLCHLLMKVNYVKVANVYVANMSLKLFTKIKFSRKFPNLQ